mgnify:CR=1 FL=1
MRSFVIDNPVVSRSNPRTRYPAKGSLAILTLGSRHRLNLRPQLIRLANGVIGKRDTYGSHSYVTLLKVPHYCHHMVAHPPSFMAGRRRLPFVIAICMLIPLFAGCTGLGGPPEPTARIKADREEINVGESVNFDARESTSPDGTIVSKYCTVLV